MRFRYAIILGNGTGNGFAPRFKHGGLTMSTTTHYTATDSFTDEQTFDTFRKTVTLTSGYSNGKFVH